MTLKGCGTCMYEDLPATHEPCNSCFYGDGGLQNWVESRVEPKDCDSCRYESLDGSEEPCCVCDDEYDEWKPIAAEVVGRGPKVEPKLKIKTCYTCKHGDLRTNEEPCRNCDDDHDMWEPIKTEKENPMIGPNVKDYGVPEDMVKCPKHYTDLDGKPEVWDWIERGMTDDEYRGGLKFAILKYLRRYRSKNGLEDLRKCQKFLEKLYDFEQEVEHE